VAFSTIFDPVVFHDKVFQIDLPKRTGAERASATLAVQPSAENAKAQIKFPSEE